ncbi:hypothetical protein C5167_027217 [Papaver somniferum]|nr:hypothetical protein C5167_027217 [Papaver somniferum]
MRDVDFNNPANDSARLSKDVCWVEYPIVMEGPYITDKDADGSTLPLPEGFYAYKPWEFRWPEEDDVGGRRVVSKSGLMNPSKKRKKSSPTPLNTSSYDDALLPCEDSASSSFMGLLSDIFSNSLSVVDNPALGRVCDAVVKICDAPALNHDSFRGVASSLDHGRPYVLCYYH